MNKGRPIEEKSPLIKYTQIMCEVPSKPEIGGVSKWYYNKHKVPNGPYKTEYTPPKGYKHPKVLVEKKKPYNNQVVVLVYKNSNRVNSKIKMKIFNENIDYIITSLKLVGIPDTAEVLELGVGNSLINVYKQKYKL